MKLFVMRHGPAEDAAPLGRDADRALTAVGRDRVRGVAQALVDHGEAPFAILSSPLARALQTAEIVASVTQLDARVRESAKAIASGAPGSVEVRRELAPGGAIESMLFGLARQGRKRLMVVGHEPDLAMLVERLVGPALDEGMLKSMVVGLKIAPDQASSPHESWRASLRFVLHPKTLVWHRPLRTESATREPA